jgi:hypothetical protein
MLRSVTSLIVRDLFPAGITYGSIFFRMAGIVECIIEGRLERSGFFVNAGEYLE